MRKPESIQERMAQVRKAQAAGTYTRCPRCGENTMKLGDRLCTNALSRQYWSKRHEVKHHKSRKYTGIKKSTDIASIVDCIPLNRRENKSVS